MSNKNYSNKDKSKFVAQREKIKNQIQIRERNDLTEKQKAFLELAARKETNIIIIDGPSGVSKTFLAILAGLRSLNDKKSSDLIYVRSAVESTDSRLGFLKGSEEDKLNPYLQPLVDKLDEFLNKDDINKLIKEQRIMGKHTGFLRGLSWNVKFIIGDEVQNMSLNEIRTLMTRIGKFSKLILIGDSQQNDLNGKSGFRKIYDLFNNEISQQNGIYCLKFTKDDILRSGVTRFVVEKFEELDRYNQKN